MVVDCVSTDGAFSLRVSFFLTLLLIAISEPARASPQTGRSTAEGTPDVRNVAGIPARRLSEPLTVERYGDSFSRYFAHFYLGDLDPGAEVPLTLSIRNTSEDRLDIDTLKTSCNCFAVSAEKRVYLPGESIDVEVVLRVASRGTGSKVIQSLALSKGDQAQQKIQVKVEYSVKGMLNFVTPTTMVELTDRNATSEIELPFVVSPPVRINDLEVTSVPLELVKEARIEAGKKNGKPNVVLDIDMSKISPSGKSVTVSLKDKASARVDETRVEIRRRQPIEISPKRIHLRKAKDFVTGTAILHYFNKQERAEDSGESLPIVSASIGGRKMGCKLVRLNDSVFRLSLKAKVANLDLKQESIIRWTVVSDRGSVNIDSPTFFLASTLETRDH